MIVFFDDMDKNTREIAIQFYHYLRGRNLDSFSNRIFDLIATKADAEDLKRIELGFPDHVHIWEHYKRLNNPSEFESEIFNYCIKQKTEAI